MGKIAVIGSIFVDFKGFPFNKYITTGRNVGDIRITHGGVSRNVAENLANIGCDVEMVTLFTPDAMGNEVRSRLAARGVGLTYAMNAPAGMGMWLAVMDENGDLAGSISRQPDFTQMAELIRTRGEEIVQSCDRITLEIDMRDNIADMVFDLAERYNRDVYVIVGNMSVILRRQNLLPRARMFILNEIEAGELFGCTLDSEDPVGVLEITAREAKRRGIREIVVTLGRHGAVYCDTVGGECGTVPAEHAHLVDSTGAGDAFFSGTVAARMKGMSLGQACRRGSHLAALTIQTEESTCPIISM